MEDQIKNYTDQLKKTYRQSLDVILPFTSLETVVYCNDDDFGNFLKDTHSLKDLQVCIYLLGRHIDVQQKIIKGLMHLQEIQKYDQTSTECNDVMGKLIDAQSRLAVLRSRTVRCLTKQIQQRCGDCKIQLPLWSETNDNKTNADLSKATSDINGITPLSSDHCIDDISQNRNNDCEESVPQASEDLSNSVNERIDEIPTRPEYHSSTGRISQNILKNDEICSVKDDEPNKADVINRSTNSEQIFKIETLAVVSRDDNHGESIGKSSAPTCNSYNSLDDSRDNDQHLTSGHTKRIVEPVDEIVTVETIQNIPTNEDDEGKENREVAVGESVVEQDERSRNGENVCISPQSRDNDQHLISGHTKRSVEPVDEIVTVEAIRNVPRNEDVEEKENRKVEVAVGESVVERDEKSGYGGNVCIFPKSRDDDQHLTSGHIKRTVEPVDEIVTVEAIRNVPRNEDDEEKENRKVEVAVGESVVERDEKSGYGDNENTATSIENAVAFGHEHLVEDIAPGQALADAKMNTMKWNPSMLIKEILGEEKEMKSNKINHEAHSDEMLMAGYLEKLPVNKKKASLLKNWRKRYFKIMNGKLFYFEDHRAPAPISFIKLAECQVKDIGNKCLEVTESHDYGGKLLVLRCATSSELHDWRTALESQQMKKENNFELQNEENAVIIIDFGSSSIKAGFLQDEAWPQLLIPSVYAVNKENSKNISYGYEALSPSVRYNSKLFYPLRSAVTVGKSVLDPNELIGFLELIFRKLQVDASHYKVIMTIPVNLTLQDKDRLVEIMLDCFHVAGVYMTSQAMLSMYSYSATSGIVVNIGDNIEIVPVEDGYVVDSGVSHLPYGGRQVTDHFVRMLSSSGHRYFSEIENYIGEYLKVKDDTSDLVLFSLVGGPSLLFRPQKENSIMQPPVCKELWITRLLEEVVREASLYNKTCYVSQDYDKENKENAKHFAVVIDMSEFNLPNGDKLVAVGKERITAFEGFLKPRLWGKDFPSLQNLIYKAVMACSIDSRKDLCRNIYLSGGSTKVQGFAERLQTELNNKFPSSVPVKVHASEERQFAAFIGAAVLASLHTFDTMCITREEWEEVGPDILRKWDSDI